ncbi:MAG: ABC transporter permease [Aerococcus sp.]|nr:ABC transporter permease [Aerococcus sp.]
MSQFILFSVAQGLMWSILGIGIYLAFRILDIADMTAEGAYPLGAAVCATLIIHHVPAWIATVMGFVAGLLAGYLTGFLHTKMHIPGLLAGILSMTALYSINLRIMGQANISLLGENTLPNQLEQLGVSHSWIAFLIGGVAVIIVISGMVAFMYTERGLDLRATGDNPIMAEANGIPVNRMKRLGLMLSSGCTSLAGALLSQANGYADIGMGTGALVIGLAAIFIAEVLFRNLTFGQRLCTIVIGSILYRVTIDLIMRQEWIEIQPGDIKLLSAIVLALILWGPHVMQSPSLRRLRKAGSSHA